MKKILVLQLGEGDFSKTMQISESADWHYEPLLSELPKGYMDVVILDREVTDEEYKYIVRFSRAYCLFVTERVSIVNDSNIHKLILRKNGEIFSMSQIENLVANDLPDYFAGFYGEKYEPSELSISDGFDGTKCWNGFERVDLEGFFGEKMKQVVFWRNSIPIEKGQYIDFWLEYKKDDDVEIELEIVEFTLGSVSTVNRVWNFSEEELQDIVHIGSPDRGGRIFVSLKAKGSGRLSVIGLHDRYSRRGKGYFLPGGKRAVTSDREEVFYYFDPGNMKPPLNVYFSGYKTGEGFEGYNMMRRLGHPFLLITESRLEGGGFYLGTEEFEGIIERVIHKHLNLLGFSNSELILSGLSMGTFGAMYYGCRLRPNTILLGKPLASLGDMAENERIRRPGGFPTSIDVLHKVCGSLNKESIDAMNHRFWDAFNLADWSSTRFVVAYMIEDDYDMTGYEKLLSHLDDVDAKVYGKGLHGRHNDDTNGIVNWFINQYASIIKNVFEG